MTLRSQLVENILELVSTRDYGNISAVTGHRKTRPPDTDEIRREKAIELCQSLIKDNSILINGGASGWDLETLIQAYRRSIPYVIVLPYQERRKSLLKTINEQYIDIDGENLLEQAIGVVWIGYVKYNIAGYHIRDHAMVLVCNNTLHAYWDGRKSRSGTFNTIKFAQRVNANRCNDKSKPEIKIFNWYNKQFIQSTTINNWLG